MDDKFIEKPGYYAIIPAIVRYDKTLSPNAKLLYGEITALLNFRNKCFASNAYFARLYDVTDIQISRLIKQLINAGHILTEMETTTKGSQRLIKLALNINVNTPLNKNDGTGVNKNVKDSNHTTNNNSLFNNNEGKIKRVFKIPDFEEVEEWFKAAKKINLAHQFYNHFTSNGWMVGRTKMKDWNAAAKNWIANNQEYARGSVKQTNKPGVLNGIDDMLQHYNDI